MVISLLQQCIICFLIVFKIFFCIFYSEIYCKIHTHLRKFLNSNISTEIKFYFSLKYSLKINTVDIHILMTFVNVFQAAQCISLYLNIDITFTNTHFNSNRHHFNQLLLFLFQQNAFALGTPTIKSHRSLCYLKIISSILTADGS